MDKMAIARRKYARGAVLTLLFGNPRAAVMQRTLEIRPHAGRSTSSASGGRSMSCGTDAAI